MALAIDTSTPAYKYSSATSGVGTQTTASFTPPVGALLVVLFSNGLNTTLQSAPTNTGGTVSWDAAAAITEAANSCAVSIWCGSVTSSASMTVTATKASGTQGDWGFGAAVVTGQAASFKGQTQIATSASGTPSGTISALTGSNSLVLGTVANFSNSTIGTAGTGQSLSFNSLSFSGNDTTSGAAGWAQYLTGMNLAAGASATINDTAPTAIDYSLCMLEILVAGGATASVPDLIMAPPHR